MTAINSYDFIERYMFVNTCNVQNITNILWPLQENVIKKNKIKLQLLIIPQKTLRHICYVYAHYQSSDTKVTQMCTQLQA